MPSAASIRGKHSSLQIFLLVYQLFLASRDERMPFIDDESSESVIWKSRSQADRAPDLRFLHFNDVYHIESVKDFIVHLHCITLEKG